MNTDQELIDEFVQKISASWGNARKLSVVLMFGGFQGAGKTTVLDLLIKHEGLLVIPTDKIRGELIDFRGFKPYDERFDSIVDRIVETLQKMALDQGYFLARDRHYYPPTIKETREFLAKNYPNYQSLAVLFQASQDLLIKRVAARSPVPGIYHAGVEDVKRAIEKQGIPDPSSYDLVLDSEVLNPEEEAQQVMTKVQDILD
jgi:cytidylate kinase